MLGKHVVVKTPSNRYGVFHIKDNNPGIDWFHDENAVEIYSKSLWAIIRAHERNLDKQCVEGVHVNRQVLRDAYRQLNV